MSTLRCPICGGTRTTPPAFMPTDRGSVHLRYGVPDAGFLSQGLILTCVGRACLDCGYVMLFLEPEALEKARSAKELPPFS